MAGSGVKSALGLALLLLAIRQLGQLVEANEIWTEMDKDELVSWSRPAVTILTGHKDLTLGNVGDVIKKEIEEDRENRDKKGDEDYTIKLTKMAWLEIVCNENGIRGPYIYKDWLINLKKLLIADPHLKPILVECFSLQVNKLLQLEAYELKNARYSYQEQELMDSLSVPETVLDGGAKSNQRIGCLFGLSCMDFFRKRDRTSHKDVLHALEGAVSAIELFKNVHDGKLPAIFKEKSDKYNELLSLCNDEEIDSETRAERLALIEKYRETDPHLTAYLDECYLKQTRANGKGGE